MQTQTNATIYTVPSDSKRGATYDVTFYENAHPKCSCPSYQFSSGATCKHIQRLRSQGKGFQSPAVTKVFRLKYEDNEVVVVENVPEAMKQAIESLGVRKSFIVERIA